MSVPVRALAVLALAMALLIGACGTDDPTPPPAAPGEPTPTPVATEPAEPTDPTEPTEPTEPADPGPAVDFSGKTIRIVVGFAPGGGYDTSARTVAQVIQHHLPGNPRMVVENLVGGGGLRGKQNVYRSQPDGTSVGLIHGRHITAIALGEPIEGYNPFDTRIVGCQTCGPNRSMFGMVRSVASNWDETLNLGRTIVNGETEPGFSGAVGITFLEMKGYPFRILFGYGGTAEILAAVNRGELEGTTRVAASSVDRLYPEWFATQHLIPVVKYGFEDPLQEDLDPWGITADEIPHLFDLIEMTSDEQAGFTTFRDLQFGRSIWLPPGTPDNVVQVWRDAFAQMVEDPRYIDLMDAQGLDVNYATGDAMEAQLQTIAQLTPEATVWFRRLALHVED